MFPNPLFLLLGHTVIARSASPKVSDNGRQIEVDRSDALAACAQLGIPNCMMVSDRKPSALPFCQAPDCADYIAALKRCPLVRNHQLGVVLSVERALPPNPDLLGSASWLEPADISNLLQWASA